MNRTHMMTEVARRTGEPLGKVEHIVRSFCDVVSDALLEGEIVNLRRFGKFELRLRRSTIRRNPRTGEPMDIPDKVSVTFIPSVTLKNRLNNGD